MNNILVQASMIANSLRAKILKLLEKPNSMASTKFIYSPDLETLVEDGLHSCDWFPPIFNITDYIWI